MENVAVYLNKGSFFGREHIDKALKKLKTKIDNECVLETARNKRSFETPIQKLARKRRKLQKIRKMMRIKKQTT